MTEKLISVEHVWKLYGNLVANEDISLSLYEGEIVALLGPNGAGKTTLVKQLYGELLPNKGKIIVLGHEPRNREIKKHLGVIPQEVEPYGDLTAWDNIYYMGRIKGVRGNEIRQRGEELLKRLDLYEKRNVLAMNLSGGMKRKVLLAMALINNPKVLILDEPTTGLDPKARREVWEILLELKKEGKSILLTTHYLDEAEKLSDRVYFIKKRVIFEGRTSEIKKKFSDWYEVIDYETGKVMRVKGEDELKETLINMKGRFEVRLPSLEEIYLEVFRDVP